MDASQTIEALKEKAEQMGVEFVDISKFDIEPLLLSLIPLNICYRYNLICIDREDNNITVACENPIDLYAAAELKSLTQCEVKQVYADPEEILKKLETIDTRFLDMEKAARSMRVKFIDLTITSIDPECVRLVPESMARKNNIICISKTEDMVKVAMADPTDVYVVDEVRRVTGLDVDGVYSDPEDIKTQIDKHYGEDQSWKNRLMQNYSKDVVEEFLEEGVEEKDIVLIEQPIITAVNKIIVSAIEQRASDIHVESLEDSLRVRFRIDGILHEITKFPYNIGIPFISRIKVISNLDVAERRLPQDGRVHLKTKGRFYDLRVSVIPNIYGETASIRILDKKSTIVDIEKLGFPAYDLDRYNKIIFKSHGIILVVGPTGCGKTSTLYATLNKINSVEKKLLTVEDPVEYDLKGIMQVQVNPKAGLTFAKGLRAFLRQDPDIIMVGEIRDLETAMIAVEASLTGHLVLTTLHASSTVSCVTRLFDLGVEPFLIGATLEGVLSQRLVRLACKKCKMKIEPPPKFLELCNTYKVDTSDMNVYKGVGCEDCNKTGYMGRTGVYELLAVSDDLKEMITSKRDAASLEAQARFDGMSKIFRDGLEKVTRGLTTFDEFLRVSGDYEEAEMKKKATPKRLFHGY